MLLSWVGKLQFGYNVPQTQLGPPQPGVLTLFDVVGIWSWGLGASQSKELGVVHSAISTQRAHSQAHPILSFHIPYLLAVTCTKDFLDIQMSKGPHGIYSTCGRGPISHRLGNIFTKCIRRFRRPGSAAVMSLDARNGGPGSIYGSVSIL